MLYGTTTTFLERLGLPSLAALPSLAPLLEPDDAAGSAVDAAVDDGSASAAVEDEAAGAG
jgi:hypothetical protein